MNTVAKESILVQESYYFIKIRAVKMIYRSQIYLALCLAAPRSSAVYLYGLLIDVCRQE